MKSIEKHENAWGAYLRGKRIAAGLSLRDLAAGLGVSHVYLGEVERGVSPPMKRERWADLVRLVPGVTMEDLERKELAVRPLQLRLDDAPPKYQDLALALSRRLEKRDISSASMEALMRLLRGGDDD